MFGVRLGLLVLFLFFLHEKIVCATEGDKIFSLKISAARTIMNAPSVKLIARASAYTM